MILPIVELLAVLGPDARLVQLLTELRSVVDLRAPDRGNERLAARLACATVARGALDAARDQTVPLGVWVPDLDAWDAVPQVADAATAVITASADVADRAGPRAVLLHDRHVDLERLRRVPPFVRARWREATGLPGDYIASVGLHDSPALSEVAAMTALGVAAAAAVSSAWALQSLALGAPTVVDAGTAAWLGARDDVHLVVAEPDHALASGADLAADIRRAARLSRAGRRLVEERFGSTRELDAIVALLSLTPTDPDPAGALVASRLLELRTPRHALPFRSAEAALASLDMPIGLSLHRGAP
jgi:hypothetical protein